MESAPIDDRKREYMREWRRMNRLKELRAQLDHRFPFPMLTTSQAVEAYAQKFAGVVIPTVRGG